jgi:hypothetical protein
MVYVSDVITKKRYILHRRIKLTGENQEIVIITDSHWYVSSSVVKATSRRKDYLTVF